MKGAAVLLLIAAVAWSGCAGEVRFSRPGEYVPPEGPPAVEPVRREERFIWGRPSGEAWFFWVPIHRARGVPLYRGLSSGALQFAEGLDRLFTESPSLWVPCFDRVAGCRELQPLGESNLDRMRAFLHGLTQSPPMSPMTPQDGTAPFPDPWEAAEPSWRAQRWVHLFVFDVADVWLHRDDSEQSVIAFSRQRFRWLAEKLDERDGFSSARFRVTFASLRADEDSRRRCPRLPKWEGHRWRRLREQAAGVVAVGSDVDACDLIEGNEATFTRMVEDSARFQSRLILARPAKTKDIEVIVKGRALPREDFTYVSAGREVRIHESVAVRLPPGSPIQVHYWEAVP